MDWDAIILRCDDLIARAIASSKTFFERGNAHLNKGDDDRAIADYGTALRRDPYDEAVLGSLEAAYVALKERNSGA